MTNEPDKLPVGTNEATPGQAAVPVSATSQDNVRNVASAIATSHDPHDTDVPGAEVDSVRAGHEPDKFQVKSILAVPALLAIMVLLAFGIVTALFVTFYTRFLPNSANGLNEQAAAVNTVVAEDGTRRDRDVSERFARIGSTAPKDVDGVPGTALAQPRLEYLKQTAPETPDDPAFERSKRPVDSPTNTYEIRPEDLRPQNYVDPVTRERTLATYGWVDENRKIARMPIGEAIRQVVTSKKLKARKDAIPAPGSSIQTPTLSNGGRPAQGNATQASGGPTPPMPSNHGQKTAPGPTPDKPKH